MSLNESGSIRMSETSWETTLRNEKQQEYFRSVLEFVESERSQRKIVYPPKSDTFNALRLTPISEVKVVIIGQDPYHGPNQAHGLCFSVPKGTPFPPSLRNIFKEIVDDIGIVPPTSGNLEGWARQGVLLLNTVLTVEHGKAHSHANQGWERFTDKIIAIVNEHCEKVVFLLWGAHAQRKADTIDATKHLLLHAPHPSPLSAHRGFFGCKHFSKTNQYLREHHKREINWGM